MDKKFLSPHDMIVAREMKITKFLSTEVGKKAIYGWQLIVRKHNDAAIASSSYVCGLEKMVYKLSGDKHEVLLDSGAIAIKAYAKQQCFEAQGLKVYFDCGVVSCSREGRLTVGTDLKKAIELTSQVFWPQCIVKNLINRLYYERNIRTIGDLLCFERKEIECVHGIGPKSMDILNETLANYHTAWGALKRPRNVMNGTVVLELQVVVKDKNL